MSQMVNRYGISVTNLSSDVFNDLVEYLSQMYSDVSMTWLTVTEYLSQMSSNITWLTVTDTNVLGCVQ